MKSKAEMFRFGALYLGVLGLALATAMSCNPVIMVAPPGASIELFANPRFIPAHGGVAEITAIVMKKTGVPVADGTVVQFFTTLGRIEEQGKTNDGVARVKLVSDSRSGTAQVSAFSGGGTVTTAPTSTATATATATGTATSTPGAGTGGGGSVRGSTEVTIGNVNAARIIMNAVPARLSGSRSTHIIATVLDGAGNPVPNVPVYFFIDGPPANERLDSAGNPIFTDNNGRAEDILRTIATFDMTSYPVTVKAQTINSGGNVITGEVVIRIN